MNEQQFKFELVEFLFQIETLKQGDAIIMGE